MFDPNFCHCGAVFGVAKIALILSLKAKFKACVGKYLMQLTRFPKFISLVTIPWDACQVMIRIGGHVCTVLKDPMKLSNSRGSFRNVPKNNNTYLSRKKEHPRCSWYEWHILQYPCMERRVYPEIIHFSV